jgi:L-aminopeptidase/D-esterase-like protein
MSGWKPGPANLITDVAGCSVGNASDSTIKSGVTALLFDEPAVAGVQILGGAPGTRETDLLEPQNSVGAVNALVLSGGSAFGLDSASGVQAALVEMGRGFQIGPHRIPIVPAAIIFDLINGGNKDWGRYPPYRDLGYSAARNATKEIEIGSHGAGAGAQTANLLGGLGSASTVIAGSGITVGALVAVNAIGSVTVGSSRHFWAGPFELNAEFGGLGLPKPLPEDALRLQLKFRTLGTPPAGTNTTVAIVVTDATLTKAQCKRLAMTAHDGFARAIWPAHTPFDGDLVFAASTARKTLEKGDEDLLEICAAAAATVARAIARGVHAASPGPNDMFPAWKDMSG